MKQKVLLLIALFSVFIASGDLVIARAEEGNRKDSEALVVAVLTGETEIVELLLDAGADVNAKVDGSDGTVLEAAILMGHTDIVRRLVAAGAYVEAKDLMLVPLVDDNELKYADIVKTLLVSGVDVNIALEDGTTALMKAAFLGNGEVVRALIVAGADVNARGPGKSTALMMAAIGGSDEVIRALISAGADMNAGDENGRTFFYYAMLRKQIDILKEVGSI